MVGITRVLAVLGAVGLAAIAAWQLSVSDPLLPYAVSGLLLLGTGIVSGLRIGYESTKSFIDDAARMNRLILELNASLSELNAWLMRLVVSRQTEAGGSRRDVHGQPEAED